MKKREIKDIVCSSTPYGQMYTDNDLIGSIIIDGKKFEGIVKDYNDNSYFVFGRITKDKIKLLLSSEDDYNETTKLYKALKLGSLYTGDKYVVTKIFEMASEECSIKLLDRKLSLDEIVDLEENIVERREILSDDSNYFYKKLMGTSYVKNKVKTKKF